MPGKNELTPPSRIPLTPNLSPQATDYSQLIDAAEIVKTVSDYQKQKLRDEMNADHGLNKLDTGTNSDTLTK